MDLSTASFLLSGLAVLVGFSRFRVAERNNIITGSTPWAQVLMKYIEEEIKLSMKEEALMKGLFERKFESARAKQEFGKLINVARDESTRNLAFLETFHGSTESLLKCRAQLSSVYDSFLESADLKASGDAKRAFFEHYDKAYKEYLMAIRAFAMSVSVERAKLATPKPWFRLRG